MATLKNLKDYLAHLKQAPVVLAMPGESDWKAHVDDISMPEQIVQVTEEDYYYWLEVLPPRWMRGSHFCFAEGDEAFRLFWQEGNSYFCRQLSNDETLFFCSLASIEPPRL